MDINNQGTEGAPVVLRSSDTSWMAHGNCATQPPTTFFPSDGVGVELARKVCVGCPVKDPCLEHALTERIDHGVWGGTSERERRRILRQRRLAVAKATSATQPAQA